MSHNRKVRPHTGRSGVSQSGRSDEQATPVSDSDPVTSTARGNGNSPREQTSSPADNPAPPAPADSAATDGTDSGTAAHNNTDRRGPALIGPTSEATRRWVAESRMRQGLSPRITDPVVLDSLALFLRNAIDSLDRDRRRRDDT
ncbi:hypothetical protein BOX37_23715 [Nocardia mangyaensis]|uniref:Uncharacterized protein n=1 Tax=Nocardia mangyaensis TaxID=2213200 RepID=A0A1J0VWY1_9NOCA|nr:hypothetical protein [Nocardia mangyaensis]APE36439.1 hypothetical protein BOX37_23715 [Nocardia mangyaensis]